MPACKVCGHWFVKIKPQEELCDKCESALYRLSGYVAPVRHGRWLDSKHKIFSNTYDYVCSNCGCDYALAKYNYCPSCGAKMQEVE